MLRLLSTQPETVRLGTLGQVPAAAGFPKGLMAWNDWTILSGLVPEHLLAAPRHLLGSHQVLQTFPGLTLGNCHYHRPAAVER